MSVMSGVRAVVTMRPLAAHACHNSSMAMQRASPSAAFLGAFLQLSFQGSDAEGELRAASQ
jgi:hypothetical protein